MHSGNRPSPEHRAAGRPHALPSKLYAILDVDVARARAIAPIDLARLWLDAGVRVIQLRAKHLAGGEFLRLADDIAARCRDADAIFIVNDRADVAKMSGASGVHVGQDDLPAASVRAIVGDDAWVGLSTHNDAQLAAARAQPVNYVAIGPVFPTATKNNPDPTIGLETVRRAAPVARAAGLPLVAIGGITLQMAPAVIDAGADAVAVISDLCAGDHASRARAYLASLL